MSNLTCQLKPMNKTAHLFQCWNEMNGQRKQIKFDCKSMKHSSEKNTKHLKKTVPTILPRTKNALEVCYKRIRTQYLRRRRPWSRGWLLTDAGPEEVRQLLGRETRHSGPNPLPKKPPKRFHPATIQSIYP